MRTYIKLMLRTSIFVFFIFITLESFGMMERDISNNNSNNSQNIFDDDNNIDTYCNPDSNIPPTINNNGSSSSNKNINDTNPNININKNINDINKNITDTNKNIPSTQALKVSDIIRLNNRGKSDFVVFEKPFNDTNDNKGKLVAFHVLFNTLDGIYSGYMLFVLCEIMGSLAYSILNNMFEFEKIPKRSRFYYNLFLLNLGYERSLPGLSFIILDFNICAYNWIFTLLKFVLIGGSSIVFNSLNINYKRYIADKKYRSVLLTLFNVFNIHVKINISFLNIYLCIPLTKIFEYIIIYKGHQYDCKKKTQSNIPELSEVSDTYKKIYNVARTDTNKVHTICSKMQKWLDNLEEKLNYIQKQSVQILKSKGKPTGPQHNRNNINNIHNNENNENNESNIIS